MRVALISDIHSNLPALTSVKDAIERLGVDYVVCAGDIVGYGASPNECCRIVAGWAGRACVGNHDLAALRQDASGMNQYAARAALWTSEHLDDASRKYLRGLDESVRLQAPRAACSVHHGSLRGTSEYLYEEDVNEEMLGEARAQVLVFGHTHVPYVRRYRSGTIVNPGSVGQPRDGDQRASFGILDLNILDCEIVRIEYDIDTAADKILSAGLPMMLADRLSRGL